MKSSLLSLVLVGLRVAVSESFGYQAPILPSAVQKQSVVSSSSETQIEDRSTNNRRKFFQSTFAAVAATSALSFPALADVTVKVTPLAHTFVTSSGTIKPIRENDATRILTNARVVILTTGSGSTSSGAQEILDLTVQRKAGKGAGVTAGNVQVLQASSSVTANAIQDAAISMPAGDVLFVGPVPSKGSVAEDAKLVSEVASSMNLKVNSEVVSVLLDGPTSFGSTDQLATILWYQIP